MRIYMYITIIERVRKSMILAYSEWIGIFFIHQDSREFKILDLCKLVLKEFLGETRKVIWLSCGLVMERLLCSLLEKKGS